MRTKEAKKLVLAYHMGHNSTDINYTHYYNVVNPIKGGECRIDIYALRLEGRTRKPLVKCVQRYYSNRTRIDTRDVYRGYMGGFQVDFSDMTRNCRHYAESYFTPESLAKNPVGEWDYFDFEGWRTSFTVWGTTINDYAGTKYAKSGIMESGLHPMRFFQLYRISKSVEFLVKGGLQWLLTPSFVTKLRDRKDIFNFFRMNLGTIKKDRYSISEITYAVSHKCDLFRARLTLAAIKKFKDSYYAAENIPKEIDRYELSQWCVKNNVQPNEYKRYASYINRVGGDLTAFGVTYPRDFRTAIERAEAEADRLRRREERAKKKAERLANADVENAIKEMAKRLATLNGITGSGYCVVVPKSRKDLVDEGKAMRNCIGAMGYDRKIANGDSLIFFLRGLDGKRNVDVEVRVERKGKRVKLVLAQCYEPCNTRASEEAHTFAHLVIKEATKILRKAA